MILSSNLRKPIWNYIFKRIIDRNLDLHKTFTTSSFKRVVQELLSEGLFYEKYGNEGMRLVRCNLGIHNCISNRFRTLKQDRKKGKILISDSIFDKDRKVTPEEAFEYIKRVASSIFYSDEEVYLMHYLDYSAPTKIRLSSNLCARESALKKGDNNYKI